MRILPILYNTEMVKAILDERKICTRRVLKHPFEVHPNGYITKPQGNAAGVVGWTAAEAAEALTKAMKAAAVQMKIPNEVRRLCDVDTTNKEKIL